MSRKPQIPEPSHQAASSPDIGSLQVVEEAVLGVDTHKDVHVTAVISGLGVLLGPRSFPTTAVGYRQLLN